MPQDWGVPWQMSREGAIEWNWKKRHLRFEMAILSIFRQTLKPYVATPYSGYILLSEN